MKKPLVFLALSLAANAALLVTFLVRPGPRPTSDPIAAGAIAPAVDPLAGSVSATTGLNSADARILKRSAELLSGNDLHLIAARLRAAGYPPALIRAMIQTMIRDQFVSRRLALTRPHPAEFWSSTFDPYRNYKLAPELQKLAKEQAVLLKELVGPDIALDDPVSRLQRETRFGSLPAEKIDRLQSITSDYNELRSQIGIEARGVFLPADREKFTLLEQEERADIVKSLSPAELEDYDLRNSPLSFRLRDQLADFSPTEEEFRTLFRLQAAFDHKPGEPTGAPGTANPESLFDRLGTPATLQAQIEAALGPARAAEYKQAIDPAYQQVSRLLNRLELPAAIAPQVVTVQQDIQQRANAVRQNRALSADDRASQLTILAQEAQVRLTTTLGENGYTAYKNYGGEWLNTLTPRPSASPAPKP